MVGVESVSDTGDEFGWGSYGMDVYKGMNMSLDLLYLMSSFLRSVM